MSLQDESFPADEFLDKLTFSPLPSSKGFQFLTPKYENQGDQLFPNWEKKQELPSPSLSAVKLTNRQPNQQSEVELNEPHSTYSSSNTSITTTTATSNGSRSPTSLGQNLPGESNSSKREQLSRQDSKKTCVSDPDTCDNSPKKLQFQSVRSQTKAGSYQDIHSEYTKRRFKHVASKVAEYIANMKAEEMKRRRRQSQFERHRSLPETLCGSAELTTTNEKQLAKLSFSTDGLQCRGTCADELFESNSDGDEGDIESAANTSAATTTNNNDNDDDNDNEKDNLKPSSNSSSNASTSGHSDNNNSNSTAGASNEANQEASNETNTGDTIDKGLFNRLLDENERIQSYNEHLQMKLDEKAGENMRLKRNVDYLRIELTNCQDKLKEKDRKISYLSPMIMMSCQSGKTSIATQTDFLETASTPPSLPLLPQPANSTATTTNLFITPDTPDSGKNTNSNNNSNNNINNSSSFNRMIFDDFLNSAGNSTKSVATIQPLSLNYSQNMETIKSENCEGIVLRQRTNSNNLRMKYKSNNNNNISNNNNNNSNQLITKNPPKIHKNSKKLNNPKSKKNNKKGSDNSKNNSDDSVIDICPSMPCSSPQFHKNYPLRKHISGITSDSSSRFLQPIDTSDDRAATTGTTNAYNENYDDIDETVGDPGYSRKPTIKKHNRLRRQWLRLLGKCARCTDPHALDNSVSTTQTYTQIPLLEKSLENNCENVR